MSLATASALFAALVATQPPPGTNQLLVYPQSPGCTGTLQACIDNAIDGDIIELATDTPIDEDILLQNTLVLRPAAGFSPVIGTGNTDRTLTVGGITPTPLPPFVVTVEGLTMDNVQISAALFTGADHGFHFRNNVIINESDAPGSAALRLQVEVPAEVVVEDNEINGPAYGIFLQVRNDGVADVRIQRNRITTSTPNSSERGIFLDLDQGTEAQVDVISNIVFGTGGFGFSTAAVDAVARSQTILNVSHNTVYGADGVSNGISISPQADATGTLNMLNNTASANGGRGFQLLNRAAAGAFAINFANNHSSGNAEDDFLFDSEAGVSLGDIALDGDPGFVNAPAGDFRLREGSILVDAALDDPAQGSLSADAAGNARPAGNNADVGALEFAGEPFSLFLSTDAFVAQTSGTVASAPYPGPLNRPAEPFVSGQISLQGIAPSSLNFADWIADPLVKGGIPVLIYELALNGNENLIVRSTVGPVFGMGIEFNDAVGGSSPSTFQVRMLADGAVVGELDFQTPNSLQQDFVGVWSPVPFDELQILELALANENEIFGQVYTTQLPNTRFLFANGFE